MRNHVPFLGRRSRSRRASRRFVMREAHLREEPWRQHEPCVLGTTHDANVAEEMLEDRQRDVGKLTGSNYFALGDLKRLAPRAGLEPAT